MSVGIYTKNYPSKPPLGVQINRGHPIGNSIIGLWLFNEGAGQIAYDISPFSNNTNGTLTSVTWDSGLNGYCVSCNGSTSSINCGTSSVLNPQALSVFCWIKFNSLSNSYTCAVGRDSTNSSALLIKSTGKLAIYVTNVNSTASYDGTGTYTLATGIWYHIGFTVDKNTITGYVNGLVDNTTTMSGNAIQTYSATFGIGYDPQTASRILNGWMDSVIVCNKVLSAFEVNQLYRNTYCFVQPVRRYFNSNLSIIKTRRTFSGNLRGR